MKVEFLSKYKLMLPPSDYAVSLMLRNEFNTKLYTQVGCRQDYIEFYAMHPTYRKLPYNAVKYYIYMAVL